MKFTPVILIRVDAKKEVALGHFKRCISLAFKLHEKGAFISFLTTEDDYARRSLFDLGFDHTILDSNTNSEYDWSKTLETARNIGATIIIVDSYEIDDHYRQKLIDNGFFVVSINDTRHTNVSSHIIINGNLNAEKTKYTVPDKISVFSGIKYLILGKDFWNLSGTTNNNIEEVSNILITMGGIDHYDLTTKILKLLDRVDSDFNITVIVGPYYENMGSIKPQVDTMRNKVNLVNSPPGLFRYMKNCSLAFCAGGQTLYELAALGRPTIGIALWKNQAGNVNELSKIGAISSISYSDKKSFDGLFAERAERLIRSSAERKRMSRVASSLVDGKGAERVSNVIFETYERWLTRKISKGDNREKVKKSL